MIYNHHQRFEGLHSFLSPSSPAWVNYDLEKLKVRYSRAMAAQRGTELHDYANKATRHRRMQPDDQDSLNQYINDAIVYGMRSEQTLFYSFNCFGTADAISFRDNKLRIHDLKTGVTKASFMQLFVYAALFCLEYDVKPYPIDMEFRIYQNDEIKVCDDADPGDIVRIMGKIKLFDECIEELREEEAAA